MFCMHDCDSHVPWECRNTLGVLLCFPVEWDALLLSACLSVCLSVPTGRSVKCTSPRSVTRLAFLNCVYICHFCTIPECWQFHEHINARSREWVVLVTSLFVCPLPLSISRKPHFWGLHDKSSMSPWLWQCITVSFGVLAVVLTLRHLNQFRLLTN